MDPSELYRKLQARLVPSEELQDALAVFLGRCTGPQADETNREQARTLWRSTVQPPPSPISQTQVQSLERLYGQLDFYQLMPLLGGLRPSHGMVVLNILMERAVGEKLLTDLVWQFSAVLRPYFKVGAWRGRRRGSCIG